MRVFISLSLLYTHIIIIYPKYELFSIKINRRTNNNAEWWGMCVGTLKEPI